MNVCEFFASPWALFTSGVSLLISITASLGLFAALIMSRMKSSWPMPLITIASSEPIFAMSSADGWKLSASSWLGSSATTSAPGTPAIRFAAHE